MMAYEFGGEILVVDAGIMFPQNDMLGVDYIIPDFEYLLDKIDRVRAIVITHGHEDHIGAIQHVINEIPAPIYATPLTRGLIEAKLARNGGLDKAVLNTMQAGDTLQLCPFKVETFHICHSIPDSVGLGITTPAGLVIHMSDFKFDHTPVDGRPTDYAKLAEFSERGRPSARIRPMLSARLTPRGGLGRPSTRSSARPRADHLPLHADLTRPAGG
jgi:ribonuclease J